MLQEPVHYYKNLNFAIDFSNVAQEAPHCHKETEMALVLRGSVTYRIHHQEFQLKTGDAIIIDTNDLHYIVASSEDVIMLTFYINMEAFTDVYPNIDFMIFACEELIQTTQSRHQKMQNRISFLIHHMAQMMFLRADEKTEDSLMTEKLQEILYLMVNHFQGFFIENREFRSGNEDATPAELDRLYRIITYMYQNYDQKLTLQDVAEMEHLSMYYASHMIKRLSGLSFQNLLNYIRVENSEKLLNENKYTLTQISEFCGFSSLAYYNKCFKTWHGITPAQYKKRPKPAARSFHKPFDRMEALQLLEPYLNVDLPDHPEAESRFSSHHIFLPIQQNYESGVPFREVFPLNLVVDSPEQMSMCSRLPFVLDSVVTGSESPRSAASPAEALAYLLKERNPKLHYHSLLTSDGLPTPFFALLKALHNMDGLVCEKQQQYILVKNSDYLSLTLFNPGESNLHVHLQFNQGNKPEWIVKKVLPQIAVESLPKPLLFDLADGSTTLLSEPESELTVAPGDVVILAF